MKTKQGILVHPSSRFADDVGYKGHAFQSERGPPMINGYKETDRGKESNHTLSITSLQKTDRL
jgi:hypothetical protein